MKYTGGSKFIERSCNGYVPSGLHEKLYQWITCEHHPDLDSIMMSIPINEVNFNG